MTGNSAENTFNMINKAVKVLLTTE